MTWIFCTSGSAIAKAGVNANSDIVASGSLLATWSDQAEAEINTMTRINFSDSYSGLDADFQGIIGQIESDMVAMNIISYDMSGYSSRYESETMLDVIWDRLVRNISLLRDDKFQKFINGS